jgi:hypothetical protein
MHTPAPSSVVTSTWPRPAGVKLDGDDLLVAVDAPLLRQEPASATVRSSGHATREVGWSVPMLDAFLRLGRPDSTPKDVKHFVRSFGAIGVCAQHGLPSTHNQRCDPVVDEAAHALRPRNGVTVYREPRATYVRFSSLLDGLLEMASWLMLDEPLPAERADVERVLRNGRNAAASERVEWSLLQRDELLRRDEEAIAGQIRSDRARVAAEFEWLFGLSGSRPMFRWAVTEERPSLALFSGGPFASLVFHAAQILTDPVDYARCRSCGRVFEHARQKGQRRGFCFDCGTRGRTRINRRIQRRRERLGLE